MHARVRGAMLAVAAMLPGVALAELTHVVEQAARQLDNDRVQLAAELLL